MTKYSNTWVQYASQWPNSWIKGQRYGGCCGHWKVSQMGMKELRNPHDIAFQHCSFGVSLYISPKFSTSNLMLLSRDIPFKSNNWFPSESIIDIHGNLKGTTWWWPLSAAVVTWTVPRRSLWLGAKHGMYPTGNEYLQKCILFAWQLEVVCQDLVVLITVFWVPSRCPWRYPRRWA